VAVALLVVAPAAASPAPVRTVRLAAPARTALYGERVVVRGRVSPPKADVNLALEQRTLTGWRRVGHARTVGGGKFAAALVAHRGGRLRAVVLASRISSPAVWLRVKPRITLTVKPGRAFVGAELTARVQPASFSGSARVVVWRNGPPLATVRARVRNGRVHLTVPTPGIGRFSLVLKLGAANGLCSAEVLGSARAAARTVSVGSSGPDVTALARRLAELRFHVPSFSSTYSAELFDSVIAFQKAAGLSRDGVVGPSVWATLGRAAVLRPHYAGPSPHIEVDKGHQLLLVVRGGQVSGIVPVSTGATGNTPVGRWSILWKAPATGTWLGSATLYRTMDFHGNFAIHGFYSVPAYPASHGCVRVPIWAADWLYNQSPVGEAVYVYE
jgi:hypothetical protein